MPVMQYQEGIKEWSTRVLAVTGRPRLGQETNLHSRDAAWDQACTKNGKEKSSFFSSSHIN